MENATLYYLINNYVVKELICQVQENKMPNLPTLPAKCNYGKTRLCGLKCKTTYVKIEQFD